LIDQDLKQWDRSLISIIFLPEEAATIMNIPLSPFQPRDRLIWRCTANGGFTVKNAYHLGIEMKNLEKAGSSKTVKTGDTWKKCWSLNVPNAVKMFLWKACHDLLSTKVNLLKRGVCDNSLCPICLLEEELVVHVVWACPATNDAWGETRIRLQKSSCEASEFSQFFLDVVTRCDKEEVELFAVLARRL
jgi:hypothetical protein